MRAVASSGYSRPLTQAGTVSLPREFEPRRLRRRTLQVLVTLARALRRTDRD
jgi:hypothetical protein